jgi:hypothetical protein
MRSRAAWSTMLRPAARSAGLIYVRDRAVRMVDKVATTEELPVKLNRMIATTAFAALDAVSARAAGDTAFGHALARRMRRHFVDETTPQAGGH